VDRIDPPVLFEGCSMEHQEESVFGHPDPIIAEDFAEDELGIINEINRRVAAANNIVELVDFVFSRLPACMPCERIGIAFVEEQGWRLVSHYHVASFAPLFLIKDFAQDLRGSSLETVIRKQQPRILNDLEAYLAEHPDSVSTKLIVREGVHSSLTCPLLVEGRPIGAIFFSSRQKNAYEARHVRLTLAIAERLSQAAEKAYRIEQLENANRAYMEMLGFVAHELKNPVSSMMTNAQLLADGYLGEVVAEQREKLERIVRQGEHLLDLIGDYLSLARIESADNTDNFALIEDFAGQLIAPALELLAEQVAERRMRIETAYPEKCRSIYGDMALLRIVVSNLVSNGIKYGNEGGLLRICLTQEEKHTEFSVWNEGPGFPPEKQSQLFRRFSRLNTPELMSRKGTGIGLYTCWKVAQLHAGSIRAESKHGQWARFIFRIPNFPPGFG